MWVYRVPDRLAALRELGEHVPIVADTFEGVAVDIDETSRSQGPGPLGKVEARLEERLRAGLEEARNDLFGRLRTELKRESSERESRIEQETERALDSIRGTEQGAVKSIEATMDRVREAGEAAAARAQASVASLTARVESAAKEMSRRSRRHELKLVREESSRRVEAALQGVDERAGSAKREIERAADGLRADLMRSAGDAEMRLRDQAAAAAAEQGHVERLATDSRSRLEAARSTAVAVMFELIVSPGARAELIAQWDFFADDAGNLALADRYVACAELAHTPGLATPACTSHQWICSSPPSASITTWL